MKILIIILFYALSLTPALIQAEPLTEINKDSRCQVCGMFVARYPNWLSEIILDKGSALTFDGMKDLMVYYFHPEKFGTTTKDNFQEIWTKDYYSLKWIDARQAFFVIGSDVYGPMGHEFIPFASQEAAASFLTDHRGTRVLTFSEINHQLVESMRHGMKMK